MVLKKVGLVVLSILLSVTCFGQFRDDYSDLDDSETVSALKQHVSYLASAALEGRKAGTDGERDAADYVYRQMKEIGLEMLCLEEGDIFGISRTPGDTLTSRNVMGVIQGYDPKLKDHYIVVGARMDNLGVHQMTIDGRKVDQIYYGANGNASGVALMLELAKRIRTNSVLFRRSIIFVGFGSSMEGFAGSWYFLNKSFDDLDIDAMVNLDMLGSGSDTFIAYTSSNQDMNKILEVVSAELNPVSPVTVAEEPYPSDHRSFYASEIPSVFFTTGRYVEHDTYRDTPSILEYEDMEAELEYLYNFTRTLSNLAAAPAFSKKAAKEKKEDEVVHAFYECDVSPSFMGHYDPRWFIQNWVYKYMRYPDEAVDNGIQGKVTVYFEVDKKGKVRNVKVVKGVDPILDAEAIRVVEASPDWKAARLGGKKVDSSMEIAIEFRLEKSSTKRKIKLKK